MEKFSAISFKLISGHWRIKWTRLAICAYSTSCFSSRSFKSSPNIRLNKTSTLSNHNIEEINYKLWVDTWHQCLHEIAAVCNTSRNELAVKTVIYCKCIGQRQEPSEQYAMNNKPDWQSNYHLILQFSTKVKSNHQTNRRRNSLSLLFLKPRESNAFKSMQLPLWFLKIIHKHPCSIHNFSILKEEKRNRKAIIIQGYLNFCNYFIRTWHVLPQYHTTWQAEHFLRLSDAKHPSHLETVLFGT